KRAPGTNKSRPIRNFTVLCTMEEFVEPGQRPPHARKARQLKEARDLPPNSSRMSLSEIDPALARARDLVLKSLPEGPALWLRPPGDTPCPDPESRFEQPWYPEFHRLLSLGWKPLAEESREWDRVVVFGSRQKEETRRLLDRARRVARDLVYLAVPNEYGGKSWKSELEGVQGEEVGRKSRLFVLSPLETELAVEDFGENSAGFTSTPGLFSWDKIDRGSELLAGVLSEQSLRGPVVDLGAGWGYLPTRLSPHLEFHLVEADRRGLVAAEANLKGRNVHLHWADASDPQSLPPGLKGRVPAVITNPPFHTHKKADPVLGGAFVATAGWLLKKGGACYLVGNSHLPYAKIMEAVFSNVEVLLQQDGFKVYRGLK
ncbi:MAG: methyltransferase, partial [Candidatus Eremiobacteraeota bacterium]|nr:methyltransferase [Candidatus Eremiobacteraeota bacterium]